MNDETLRKIVESSITSALRQEIVGYWSMIAVKDHKIKELQREIQDLQAELKKLKENK